MVLELRVNGMPVGPAMVVTRGADGAFCVPAAPLEALRVWTERLHTMTIEGQRWIRLAPATGVGVAYDPASQRLDVVLPPSAFRETRITVTAPAASPMTSSGASTFLNYDLEAVAGSGSGPAASGAFEMGISAGSVLAQGTATAGVSGAGARALRLDTSLTWDDPRHMRSLRLGDTITRGGFGATPLRIGGLQFTRSFEVQPGFLTGPVPTLAGSAALQSVADLYVNGALNASKEVQPGAFTFTGFPIVTGAGTVEMVVRDALGRETVVRQAYYAAPSLLRPRLSDFSYEMGFLRRDYGAASASYGRLVASASYRLGVTDRFTAEGHAAASAETQQASAGADLALPPLGLLSVSAAASRSRGELTGQSWSIGFEHRGRGFSLGGLARLTSDDYRQVGDDGPLPTLDLEAFAGLSERWGSLGLSYLRRDSRDGGPGVSFGGTSASFRIGGVGSVHLAVRTALRGQRDTSAELSFSTRLDSRTSASGAVGMRDGAGSGFLWLQRNAPAEEGWGYRMLATLGPLEGLSGVLAINTNFGQYDAEVSYRDGRAGTRIRASGGLGIAGGQVFAAQRLSDAFAVVDAGQPGVRVYADNHLIGRSGSNGRVVVTHLRSYEDNAIRLELADLPIDAEVTMAETRVRPYARRGLVVNLRATRTRSTLVRLEVPGLGPLPAGATVTVGGHAFVAAPGGEVFLSGLSEVNQVEARWPEGRCKLELLTPAGSDPQPDLGTHTCRT